MDFKNYSPEEYRAAGINAGPYALEGNPDPAKRNYRTNRDRGPGILGGVMHITAGLSDYDLPDTSAEGTTRYGANTDRDASWHVCIDSDGIIPSIRDEWTAWHAGVPDIPAVNDVTLGMEIGTGSTDWRKKPPAWVSRTIRNAAVWWAPRVQRYGIPLRLENNRAALAAAIKAGRKFGFTSHKIISPSNRTDPGWVGPAGDQVDTFPWPLFFQYLREELARLTTQEDDMPTPKEIWDYPMESPTDGTRYTAESFLVNANVKAGKALAAADRANAKADAMASALGQVLAKVLDLPAEVGAELEETLKDAVVNVEVNFPPDAPAATA